MMASFVWMLDSNCCSFRPMWTWLVSSRGNEVVVDLIPAHAVTQAKE